MNTSYNLQQVRFFWVLFYLHTKKWVLVSNAGFDWQRYMLIMLIFKKFIPSYKLLDHWLVRQLPLPCLLFVCFAVLIFAIWCQCPNTWNQSKWLLGGKLICLLVNKLQAPCSLADNFVNSKLASGSCRCHFRMLWSVNVLLQDAFVYHVCTCGEGSSNVISAAKWTDLTECVASSKILMAYT